MTEYKLFETSHCEDFRNEELAAEIIYQYLFKGSGVRKTEDTVFGKQEWNGHFAKCLLNYYGIETSSESHNNGVYQGESLKDVIDELLKSKNPSRRTVGKLLMLKLE